MFSEIRSVFTHRFASLCFYVYSINCWAVLLCCVTHAYITCVDVCARAREKFESYMHFGELLDRPLTVHWTPNVQWSSNGRPNRPLDGGVHWSSNPSNGRPVTVQCVQWTVQWTSNDRPMDVHWTLMCAVHEPVLFSIQYRHLLIICGEVEKILRSSDGRIVCMYQQSAHTSPYAMCA